MDGVRRVLMP